MYQLSTNAVSIIVLALSLSGLEVSNQQVVDLVSAIGILVSFYGLIRNQFARKDIKGFFIKKKLW